MTSLTALVVSESCPHADTLHIALRQAGLVTWHARPTALEDEGLFLDLGPDLLLVSEDLGADHLERIRTVVSSRKSPPPLVLFGTSATPGSAPHLEFVADYLAPPFHPEILGRRLAMYHEHRVMAATLSELSMEAHLLRYERELQIGREIQHGFLPATLPRPQGWDLQVRFNPAREVSGDFYDSFTMVGGRRIGLVIADVCDKGVGAALFMALIRSLIRHTATHGQGGLLRSGPAQVLRHAVSTTPGTGRGGPLDEEAAAQVLLTVGAGAMLSSIVGADSYMTANHLGQGYFATVFFAVLDPATGQVIYVNGGHNPPVLIRASGELVLLPPTGPAVGLLPGSSFGVGDLVMEEGDTLFMYTDGVPEARDTDGAFFGEQRMHDVLLARPVDDTLQLLDRMDAALAAFVRTAEQSDDITTMALLRTGS